MSEYVIVKSNILLHINEANFKPNFYHDFNIFFRPNTGKIYMLPKNRIPKNFFGIRLKCIGFTEKLFFSVINSEKLIR